MKRIVGIVHRAFVVPEEQGQARLHLVFETPPPLDINASIEHHDDSLSLLL
jgi:hypothetical protein